MFLRPKLLYVSKTVSARNLHLEQLAYPQGCHGCPFLHQTKPLLSESHREAHRQQLRPHGNEKSNGSINYKAASASCRYLNMFGATKQKRRKKLYNFNWEKWDAKFASLARSRWMSVRSALPPLYFSKFLQGDGARVNHKAYGAQSRYIAWVVR